MAQQTLKEIKQLAEKMWEGCHGCDEMDKYMWTGGFMQGYLMSMQIYKDQHIQDYNAGYTDAQCNHVNDAENYANEIEYLKAKIDDIDNEIKRREDKIASLLINGTTDHDITDYIISPFGTPEKSNYGTTNSSRMVNRTKK